ncbi:flagellar hook-basal body complex protein FliE [Legionella dresdenensis]|uniref:Flagellar hook-basal body complex protein FliE n=1 Tax=Legionella dresdenensis TaxID=450200 RepID=A0ABV8CC69_9GAMM
MSDVSNTVSLINQMQIMAARAGGSSIEALADPSPFNALFRKALNEVNGLQKTTENLRTSYEIGDPNVSIGDVMVAAQKSSLAFDATLQVRNKLVQAYQDIMNMPI